jgi:hypothetical protein
MPLDVLAHRAVPPLQATLSAVENFQPGDRVTVRTSIGTLTGRVKLIIDAWRNDGRHLEEAAYAVETDCGQMLATVFSQEIEHA